MPNILLKKTFKIKPSGFSVKAEKTLSFHGNISSGLVSDINKRLGSIQLVRGAARIQFAINGSRHYAADINHDFQKYHEEDALAAIMDVMEEWGYDFKFEYDQELHSEKMNGSSMTKREVFIFHTSGAARR